MPEQPLEWLSECVDVPIECDQCGMLTTLGGWMDDDSPTLDSDLCDCDAGYRVYVSDAPEHLRVRLTALMDVLELFSKRDEGEV